VTAHFVTEYRLASPGWRPVISRCPADKIFDGLAGYCTRALAACTSHSPHCLRPVSFQSTSYTATWRARLSARGLRSRWRIVGAAAGVWSVFELWVPVRGRLTSQVRGADTRVSMII
jgi:hypothetical protein